MIIAPTEAFAADKPDQLVPMGHVIGITAFTDGAMVIDVVKSSAAEKAGIKPGDIITEIGDREIASALDIGEALSECGDEIGLTVRRNEKEIQFSLCPDNGELGVWLRDGITGIGTLTYCDPTNGTCGALGHSITDFDTGVLIPLREGSITDATLDEIIPGQPGVPGQLQGIPMFDKVIGELDANTNSGIFGTIKDDGICSDRKAYPLANISDVKTGEAVILSDALDGEIREYSVEISRVFTGFMTDGRDLMITVTDPVLLESTGGIVQGMSGSPIIQDGKFVGAVTHVLINEPSKGYGIFIENMLDTAIDLKSAA